MILLAAIFFAAFVYLAIAMATHNMPDRLSKVRESKKRQTRGEQSQSWLNQSGVGVTPLQFWGISIGSGFASFIVIYALTGALYVSAVPAIMVGVLPRTYFSRRRTKLIDERVQAWPDALRTLIASISSSQSLHQALRNLSTGGPVPLRPVFRKYSQLTQALDQKSALEVVKEELADPMSDRIIEILIAATEAGPGVVLDILRDLADVTSRDLQLREHIETMQTEQKLNAKIVFVLPYVLLVLMVLSNDKIREFYQQPIGVIVIIVGTAILSAGLLVVQKLGRIPMELRVFTSSYVDTEEEMREQELKSRMRPPAEGNPMESFS
jgi:tight adherence protein B